MAAIQTDPAGSPASGAFTDAILEVGGELP